jgi:tripartite-type tricarboxylate transporter receptor subunit TctC
MRVWACGVAVALTAFGAGHGPASAEDFYRGKTISFLIGHEPGGEYDTHARLVARYLPEHLPGAPAVVPQNMLGASGMRATNFLYNQAPRDGTTIGMVAENILQNQAFGDAGIQYDAAKLNWIGSMTRTSEIMITWHTSGIKTVDDARNREVVVGTSTKLTLHYVMAQVMNEFLGTKIRVVTGYKGGSDMSLAVERGEVDARVVAWSAIKTTKPEWVATKKINVIAQMGPTLDELGEVPNVEDLVKRREDREVIEIFTSANRLGRPIATAPEVSKDRVDMLRAAFDATMADKRFLKDAEHAHIEVLPVKGVDMAAETKRVLATSPALIERAKALVR